MPFQVCRVCYKTGHDFLSLNDEANTYSTKLAACVPELDIYIIDNPGLCEICVKTLDVAYEFRETCLKNEKRYNDTFNRNATPPQRIAPVNETAQNVNVPVQNNADNSEATTSQVGQNVIAEVVDVDVEILQPTRNLDLTCTICTKSFLSNHDKKMHDHKLHRHIKYMKRFTKLLTPMITKCQQIQPIIVFEDESVGQSSKKDDPVNNNNNNDNSNNKNSTNNSNAIQATEIANDPVDNLRNENQTFECKKCNLTFPDACEFESHNLIHVSNLCDICGKSFTTRVSLEAHKKLHNATCCGEHFSTPTLLQLHTYKEHNNACGICSQVFQQFNLLFHHLLDHMGEFNCNLCTKKFTSKVYLEKHLCNPIKNNDETKQRKPPKFVKCITCDINFSSRAEYTYHFRSVHKFGSALKAGKSVKCTKCNMELESRKKFWQHFYKLHYDEVKFKNNVRTPTPPLLHQYECAVCDDSYKTHIELQEHITKIHCIKNISVPIVDCRKDAFYRDQEGLRINFTIPPQQSQINQIENFGCLKQELSNRSKKICFCCRLMYNTRIDLYKHLKKCHRVCCTTKFDSLGLLVAHNFVHYKEREKEGIHDEITCLQCRTIYRNYKSLLAHTCSQKSSPKSHTIVKRPEAERTVTAPEVRKKHLCTIEDHESDSNDSDVVVTDSYDGPRLIKCEMCKSKFDSNASLLNHVRTTHI